MMAWAIGFVVLLAAIACCAIVCARGNSPSGAIALQASGTVGAIALLVLAIIGGQGYLYDVAIAFAVLSFTGSLVFLHYIDVL